MSHEEFPTETPALVTCGLPYANGPLHLGHLIGLIGADTYARSLRRLGQTSAFVCGSDMHGTPIAVNAQQEGVSPEAFALDWHEQFSATLPEFDIEFDNYGQTHDETNTELTREFVSTLDERGYVYEKEVSVAWDEAADQPLPDRFVEGTCPYCGAKARGDECDEGCQRHLEPGEIENPHSTVTGNPAEYREREHKFFRLSEFENYLGEFLDRLDGTDNARNQPREWVEGELKDWCITRDLDWGIDYPGEDLVLYVWVDAPIEYVASTKQYTERVGTDVYDWEAVWKGKRNGAAKESGDGHTDEPSQAGGEIVHVIGPDIIQHHAVFWPAMLRGVGYTEPRAIVASGFLTLGGESFSTSRNRAVWASDYLEAGFDPALLRYYLLTQGNFDQDTDFTWERFAERINSDLVGTLGNFCYRSLLFAHRNYEGTPDVGASETVLDRIAEATDDFRAATNEYRLRELGEIAVSLAGFGNEYIQRNEPWHLIEEDPERAKQVIRDCVQLAHAIAVLSQPVMPGVAEDLWAQLGGSGSVHDCELEDALADPAGRFGAPTELFERVEDEQVAALAADIEGRTDEADADGNGAGDPEDPHPEDPDTEGREADTEALLEERISFETFQELDLRVGEITAAEAIEGADDLLVLTVDLGTQTREIVAGLKGLHGVDELPGTRVVIVANMEKAELFGIESNGMVLAAGEEADLLTTYGDAPLGTRIR